MGHTESKVESKAVDANGEVNNNVVIEQPVQILGGQMTILLYIICVVKILQFIFLIYKLHLRSIKKRYQKSAIDISRV